MSDFNQDIENLLNAYDSNWDDYLILREQFIEKYSLSVDKLQRENEIMKKALTEISVIPTKFDDGGAGEIAVEISHDALAAIGGGEDE